MNVNAPSDVVLEAATTAEIAVDIEALFRARFDRIARVIARVVRDPARAEELAVEAFVRLWRTPRAQKPIAYTIVIGNDATAKEFQVTAMPVTILIDREGKIAVTHSGIVSRATYQVEIESLLK
jgi:hypothetical protein